MNDDEYKIDYGIQELKNSINFLYDITPGKRDFLLAMTDGFHKQLLDEIHETPPATHETELNKKIRDWAKQKVN